MTENKKDIELDKYPQALQPSFWIVVVAAGGDGLANIEFYQSRVIAYTKQEATKAVLKQLASEAPQLYEQGRAHGGWRITHVDGISAEELEKMFKDRCDLERKLDEERVHLEQNTLLQRIIQTRDINLFHQAIRDGRINNYERAYLHDKLTQGEDLDVPELIKSPITL